MGTVLFLSRWHDRKRKHHFSQRMSLFSLPPIHYEASSLFHRYFGFSLMLESQWHNPAVSAQHCWCALMHSLLLYAPILYFIHHLKLAAVIPHSHESGYTTGHVTNIKYRRKQEKSMQIFWGASCRNVVHNTLLIAKENKCSVLV